MYLQDSKVRNMQDRGLEDAVKCTVVVSADWLIAVCVWMKHFEHLG